MRRHLVAGNWKMNGNQAMAASLCADILAGIGDVGDTEVAVCPPFILIPAAANALKGSEVKVGAQDLDTNDNGAFTGQVSASMVVDSGCSYVILGHSERRALYGESSELVAGKVKVAIAAGLTPIVCLGETLEQRESMITEQVVAGQLDAVTSLNGIEAFSNAVIAYEPVWAIGTGLTATPEQAQQIHQFIRERLIALDADIGNQCRILYGGSMKPDNAAELIAKPDIDGGLIGGAALKAEDFLAICKAA